MKAWRRITSLWVNNRENESERNENRMKENRKALAKKPSSKAAIGVGKKTAAVSSA